MGEGRDKSGRFVKGHRLSVGHRGGSGRLPKKREERYQKILQRACSADDWKHICLVAVARAKAGDRFAREWIANHLIGPPRKRMDVDLRSVIDVILDWGDDDLPDQGA